MIKESIISLFTLGLVFGAFAYLVVSKVEKNKPGTLQKWKDWVTDKKPEVLPLEDSKEQIYHEKRSIM